MRLNEGQLLAKSQSLLFVLLFGSKFWINWGIVGIVVLSVKTLIEGASFMEMCKELWRIDLIAVVAISITSVIYWSIVMLFHKITNGKKRYELYFFRDKLVCTKYKRNKDSVDIPYSNIDKITFNSSKKFFIHFLRPVFGESVIGFYFDIENFDDKDCTISELVDELNNRRQ